MPMPMTHLAAAPASLSLSLPPPPELDRIVTYDGFDEGRGERYVATSCASGGGSGGGRPSSAYDDDAAASGNSASTAAPSSTEPAYVTLGDPQFLGSGLSVCVRHTFLDVCMSPPPPLGRARTEPGPAAALGMEGLRARNRPGSDDSSSEGIEEEEEAAEGSGEAAEEVAEGAEVAAEAADPGLLRHGEDEEDEEADGFEAVSAEPPPPPPPVPLEKLITPEWFPTVAWGRKDGAATPPVVAAATSAASAVAAAASAQAADSAAAAAGVAAATAPSSQEASQPSGLGEEDSSAIPPPPPPLPLEHFATPDLFENPQDGSNGEQGPEYMWAKMRSGERMQAAADAGRMQAVVAPTLTGPTTSSSASSRCIPPSPPPCYPAPVATNPAASEPPPPPAGDAADDPMSLEGAPQACGLACVDSPRGRKRVFWAVDARKLDSQDKQAVSPDFTLDLAGEGPQPFRLVIKPTPKNDGRRGAGFKKSKGRGRVELKCEVQRPSGAPNLTFRLCVGRGATKQGVRGPVSYNFADDGSCCGLPKGQEEWDFRSAIDDTRCFLICLEALP